MSMTTIITRLNKLILGAAEIGEDEEEEEEEEEEEKKEKEKQMEVGKGE